MLVLICVIRKCIELIFTSSELRALDDLLPGREKEKRKLGYQGVDREESSSLGDEEESLEMSGEVKHGQRKGYGEDLEELMAREQRPALLRQRSMAKR